MMPEVGYRLSRSHLLIAGVAVVTAIGAALLVLRPAGDSQVQRETFIETVSIGTIRFASEPGEELVDSRIVETRVVRVNNTSPTSEDITETVSRRAVSGWLPTEFQNVEIRFRVNRDTRAYEADLLRFMVADEIRRGLHTFPLNVDPALSYPIWIEELFQPLDAIYVKTAEIEGLRVLEFNIDEVDVTVWSDSHSMNDRSGDAHLTYFVEPRTGIVVDQRTDIVRRSLDQSLGWSVTFERHMGFSPETVEANLFRSEAMLDQRDSLFVTVIGWAMVGIAPLLLVFATANKYRRQRLPKRVLPPTQPKPV